MYLTSLFTSTKKPAEAIDEDALMAKLAALLGPSVDAKLKQGGEDGLNDLTLRRWLVARKWDLAAAQQDLASHAEWRVTYVAEGRIKRESVQEHLDRNLISLQGPDTTGRSLVYVLPARHVPGKDLDAVRQVIIYALDAAVALCDHAVNPRGRLMCVLDMTGFSMSNWDLGGAQTLAEVLQRHYPERIDAVVLYNPPYFFYALWKIVYAFLDPVTREKVQFITAGEAQTALPKLFEPQLLPPNMGGTASLVAVQDVVEQHRLHRGQLPAAPEAVEGKGKAGERAEIAVQSTAV